MTKTSAMVLLEEFWPGLIQCKLKQYAVQLPHTVVANRGERAKTSTCQRRMLNFALQQTPRESVWASLPVCCPTVDSVVECAIDIQSVCSYESPAQNTLSHVASEACRLVTGRRSLRKYLRHSIYTAWRLPLLHRTVEAESVPTCPHSPPVVLWRSTSREFLRARTLGKASAKIECHCAFTMHLK